MSWIWTAGRGGGGGGASRAAWRTVYSVDFRTLAPQVFGAAGVYTVDGIRWYAKANLGASVNASGIDANGMYLTSNGGSNLGTNGVLNHRAMAVPLSAFSSLDLGMPFTVRAAMTFSGGTPPAGCIALVESTNDGVALTNRSGDCFVCSLDTYGATSSGYVKLAGAFSASVQFAQIPAIVTTEYAFGVFSFGTGARTGFTQRLNAGQFPPLAGVGPLPQQGTSQPASLFYTYANPMILFTLFTGFPPNRVNMVRLSIDQIQ